MKDQKTFRNYPVIIRLIDTFKNPLHHSTFRISFSNSDNNFLDSMSFSLLILLSSSDFSLISFSLFVLLRDL